MTINEFLAMTESQWENEDVESGDTDCIVDCQCDQHLSTFVPLEFLVKRPRENDDSDQNHTKIALNDDDDDNSQAEFSSDDSTRFQWDAWKTPKELLAEENCNKNSATEARSNVPQFIQCKKTNEIRGGDASSIEGIKRSVQEYSVSSGGNKSFESSRGGGEDGHDVDYESDSDSDQFQPKSFANNASHLVDTSSEEDYSGKSSSRVVIDLVSSSEDEISDDATKPTKQDELRTASSPKVIDLVSTDEGEAESISLFDGSDDDSRVTKIENLPAKENLTTPTFPTGIRSSRKTSPTIYDSSSEEDEENDEWSVSDDLASFLEEDSDEDDQDGILPLVDLTNQITIQETGTLKKKGNFPKPENQNSASFKRNREKLSQQFFQLLDQQVFQGRLGQKKTSVSWSNKLRTTAGMTRLRKKNGCPSAAIELSTKVLDDAKKMKATLLHEMCHAAAFLIDNVARPPHGNCFKKWANHATFRTNIEVSTYHSYEIAFKFAWACTSKSCNVVIKRHSRSVDVEKHVCGRCKSKLMEVEVPSKGDTSLTPLAPRKKAPLNQYNQFVKSNSAKVREQLQKDRQWGKVAQAEVMKECARLWRERQNGTE